MPIPQSQKDKKRNQFEMSISMPQSFMADNLINSLYDKHRDQIEMITKEEERRMQKQEVVKVQKKMESLSKTFQPQKEVVKSSLDDFLNLTVTSSVEAGRRKSVMVPSSPNIDKLESKQASIMDKLSSARTEKRKVYRIEKSEAKPKLSTSPRINLNDTTLNDKEKLELSQAIKAFTTALQDEF